MLYIAALSLTMFWAIALWPQGGADVPFAWLCLAGGVLACPRVPGPLGGLPRQALLGAGAAMGVGAILLPWPASAAIGVGALALLATGLRVRAARVLIAPATILAVQLPAAHLLAWWQPQHHHSRVVASIAHATASVFRIDAGVLDGTFVLPRHGYPSTHAAAWEYLQPQVLVPLLCAIVAWHIWHRSLAGSVVAGICCALYAPVRMAALWALDSAWNAEVPGVIWAHGWTFASWLPLAWVLSMVVPVVAREPEANADGPAPTAFARRPWRALGLASIAACALVAGLNYHGPGHRKPGRVVLDYSHSEWEPAARVMDTNWYGGLSTYNYYSLADYLGRYYDVAFHSRGDVDDRLLAGADVLVVEIPTRRYSEAERHAIERFVRRGGGLWLIGDHTNVFGSTSRLNELSSEYGIAFNYDSTYELASGNLSLYRAPAHLAHPIVRHMRPFMFQSSCSLSGPGQRVMVGAGLRAARCDYSTSTYFPDKTVGRARSDYTHGNLVQCMATTHGDGRVLAFSDSTCFSGFSMFLPGEPELALRSVEWLNRRNGSSLVRWLLLVAAVVGAAGALLAARGTQSLRGSLLFALAGAALGVGVGVRVADFLGERALCLPEPGRPYAECAFDTSLSSVDFIMGELPVPDSLKPESPYGWTLGLHTFYVWTQRVGLIPSMLDTLDDVGPLTEALVIANPQRAPTPEEIRRLDDFVGSGGQVLIVVAMDEEVKASRPGAERRRANAYVGPLLTNTNALTEHYGLRVALSRRTAQQVGTLGAAPRVFPALRPVIVSGGDPLLVRRDGRAVLARARRGKGAVLVFGDGALFSTARMGPTSTVPDAKRRAVYDLEYWLLQEAMELSPGRLANRRAGQESPGLPAAWRGSRNADDLPSRNGRTSVQRGG